MYSLCVCVCMCSVRVCVCVAQYTFLPFQGFGVGKILKEVFYDGYKTTSYLILKYSKTSNIVKYYNFK